MIEKVTSHWSLVTGHWSLVTGHWSHKLAKGKDVEVNNKLGN